MENLSRNVAQRHQYNLARLGIPVALQYAFQGYYTFKLVFVGPIQDGQQWPSRKVVQRIVEW